MKRIKRMAGFFALAALVLAQTSVPAMADTSVRYLYNDARATPVAAADEQGTLLWRKHYRPFGAEVGLDGDAPQAIADGPGLYRSYL